MFEKNAEIQERESDGLKDLVEKHIHMEEQLIEKIHSIESEIEDNRIKVLVQYICEDEKRHHKLLKKVMKILVKRETITEKDWIDFIWQSVPFHGAPGG